MDAKRRNPSTPSLKARKPCESLPSIASSLSKSKSSPALKLTHAGDIGGDVQLAEIKIKKLGTKRGRALNDRSDDGVDSKEISQECSKERPLSAPSARLLARKHSKKRPSSGRSSSVGKQCSEEGAKLDYSSKSRSQSEIRAQHEFQKELASKPLTSRQECKGPEEFQRKLAVAWPSLPSPYLDSVLQRQKHHKLRVAILNACKRAIPHPAAQSCLVALTQSPWFQSKAAVHFLSMPRMPSKRLSYMSPVHAVVLQAGDIRPEILCRVSEREPRGFDVIVVPGGSAKTDLRALGEEGCAAIREFVRSGGGYCGVCAGAFLGLRHLKLAEAHLISSESHDQAEDHGDNQGDDHARRRAKRRSAEASRAAFNAETQFTKLGRRLLWCEGLPQRAEEEEAPDRTITMRYHNGPLMEIPTGSNARALCYMQPSKEAAMKAPPAMKGAVAILMQDYGGGRAIMISPHPESTQESGFEPVPGKLRLRRVLQRAVLLAAAGPSAYSWIAKACSIRDVI